ncbi:MAG: hemerythrin domain-containing protein [Candidatus Aquicultor sp.]
MSPIDLLLAEHKLIWRMVAHTDRELARMQTTGQADPTFLDISADFFRVYTDICHHGKEEHILFSELATKPLSAELSTIMDHLILQHEHLRQVVKELIAANERYEHDSKEAFQDIERILLAINTFYPKHLRTEEEHFFPFVMAYLSTQESDAMAKAFPQFDARLFHELYSEKVLQLEKNQEQKRSA